jgi:hypothetical protein
MSKSIKSQTLILVSLILASVIKSEIRMLQIDPEKLKTLISENEISLVLIYEDWCAHSKNAVKVFKDLLLSEKFLDLNIPVAFLNTSKYDDFKKFKGIKSIPIINLYLHQNEITYRGLLNKDMVMNWVIEKTKLSKIKEINELEDLQKKYLNQNVLFLYFGDSNNPRFQIFAEGYYHYPNVSFVFTNNIYIKQEYKFVKNNIYIFEKQKGFKIYQRAFKKMRYLEWVAMNLEIKYSDIFMGFLKNMKDTQNPSLILIYDKKQNTEEYQIFTNNYDVYYENLKGKLCEINDSGCKSFLKEIPYKVDSKLPLLVIMAFSKVIKQPVFYLMKQEFNLDNFRGFVKDFTEKKLKREIFSEVVEEVYDSEINEKAYKISRNSFTDFFIENYNKDKIILFYSSYCESCLRIKKIFEDQSKILLNNENNKKLVSFGFLDMSKNTYDIFNPSDEELFLRSYKLNNFKNFHDSVIDKKSEKEFVTLLRNFVDDSSTHRIEFEDIIDEM